MKKLLTVLLLLSSTAYSQNSDTCFVFDTQNAIFFGIDFTHVKFKNSNAYGFSDLPKIRDYYFKEINNNFTTSYLNLVFEKKCTMSLPAVSERNKTTNLQNIMIEGKYIISPETLDSIVSFYSYPDESKSNLGILIVAEVLNKRKIRTSDESYGTFWVCFFRISDHTLLIKQQIYGLAGGTGFDKFWTKSLTESLNMIRMNKLKKTYCPKNH